MAGAASALRLVRLIVLGALVLVGLAALAVYAISESRLNSRISAPNPSIIVPTDIAAIKHGQHIAGAIALCTRCHGADLSGSVVEDDASARVVAPNITRGGPVAGFSNGDYARAIRDGLDRDGRPLWLMPADEYSRLSDTDLGALIAYLKSLPPVSRTLPPPEIRPAGRLQLATDQSALLPATTINHSAPRSPAPSPGVTAEYGEYLVAIAGCARCHAPGLSGGPIPGAPRGTLPASNLTPSGLADWSVSDFLRAMRTGRRPDGTGISTAMPWPFYAQMSELELRAIWEFLGTIPPRPSGTR